MYLFRTALMAGGDDMSDQLERIYRGAPVLIGTPDILQMHLRCGEV